MEETPVPKNIRKHKGDKDLLKLHVLEEAARNSGRKVLSLGLGLLFLACVFLMVMVMTGHAEGRMLIVIAGVVGGYMALNIGANDVANNVGPAVGAKALTMGGALIIAAIFEASGAILAGGDVVATISRGIVSPEALSDNHTFILAMLSALLAAALWTNIATACHAPVSTTHAIVGGVIGAGAMASGLGAIQWGTVSNIVLSWVVSPVLGGLVAAGLLMAIKSLIFRQEDKIAAAQKWVPVLIALMSACFTVYLIMKGFKNVWKAPTLALVLAGIITFVASYLLTRPLVIRQSQGLENRRKAISSLFTVPLIFSAALLSFAHGANDVANAVGPLAAIVEAATSGGVSESAHIPLWVMVVGASGIVLGLLLFGPRLIRTVGEKITRMDQARAYCVALSAAVTVIAASALGLPVSSTHIAVGGVFGIGFLREYYANSNRQTLADEAVEAVAAVASGTKKQKTPEEKLLNAERRRLVRRAHIRTIAAAWVITVPASALMAAVLFVLFNWVI